MRRIEFGGVVNDSPFAILLLDGLVRDWAVLLGHDRVGCTDDNMNVGAILLFKLVIHLVTEAVVGFLLLLVVLHWQLKMLVVIGSSLKCQSTKHG